MKNIIVNYSKTLINHHMQFKARQIKEKKKID